MKRIYLEKVRQHEKEYYIGKADPRDLVRLAKPLEVGTTQDAQRPLQEKKLTQIRDHVEENGLLPNTLVLATCTPNLCVKSVQVKDDTDNSIELHYIEIPVTDSEFEQYINSIEAMDGQHRLYSFSDDRRLLKDDVPYEIGFTLFITPNLKEQREIFLICNEKQDKVASNLLMYFKEKLKLLEGAEKAYYPLVSRLNSENQSPLKGRIIMSAEKVKKGIKAQQLIKTLDTAKIGDLSISTNGIQKLTEDQLLSVLCTYFKGWQKAVGFSFANPETHDGAAYKISGIRFMVTMLPAFWDRAIQENKKFTEEFVADIIVRMLSSEAIAPEEAFTGDRTAMAFRERSTTIALAEQFSEVIKKMDSNDCNPLV